MTEISKSQFLRIIDFTFLSPFLIWYALNTSGVSIFWRNILIISAILIFIYNFINFLINIRVLSKKRLAFLND